MSEIKLNADGGGGSVSLKGPAATTGNAGVNLKLPVADGSANQVLATDGSGQLQWATDASNTNASNLTSGTLPDARFPATLPAVSGASLTNLPSSPPAFRNKVINGDFSVSQRYGTNSHNAAGYVIDRWYHQLSGGAGTQQQHLFSSGDEIAGTKTYCKMNVTSGGDWCSLRYRVEDVRSLTPGSWTLSFWAKGTTPPGGLKFWANQYFGSGGSSDVDISETSLTALTGSWVRQSLTFTVGSLGSKTVNENNSYFNFHIGQGSDNSSTAWNIEITNVQLEAGTSMTDYEKKSYGTELKDCQRYFWQLINYNNSSIAIGSIYSGSDLMWVNHFPVTMRASPSIRSNINGSGSFIIGRWHNATGGTNGSGNLSIQRVNKNTILVYSSGWSLPEPGAVSLESNTSSCYLGYEAEL
jgi:hypothetical protein